jgi:hypothetical protein
MATVDTMRFPISFSPKLSRLMAALGINRRNSWVELTPAALRVHMAWGFDLRAGRTAVGAAVPDHDRVLGWGAHGWRGRWLVNGSSQGLVRISLDPPAKGRVLGAPIHVHTLRVSVEDPDGLIAALA